MEPMGQIKTEHDIFKYCFGKPPVSLSRFPNLVVPTGERPLRAFLHSVGGVGAIWSYSPLFEEDGKPYVSQRDVVAEFRLWEAPSNQSVFMRHASYAALGHFTMVLDTKVSDDVLRAFSEEDDPNVIPFIDEMLPRLITWIKYFRWAYFPLSDELPLAMCITRPEDSQWIDRLKEALRKKNIPYSFVFDCNGRQTWRLPIELRAACGLSS